MERKNVFIAIGGSGTKVAEALVRLLAIGFPSRYQGEGPNRVATSAGEALEIWRVDPDSNSGASHELDKCLIKYRELQTSLEGHWAMEVPYEVVDLDPLILPKRGEGDNIVKSLKGVLDSPIRGKKSSRPFLDLLFEEKELDIQLDRGFYQKPFIGSAVMALFVESLLDPSSSAGSKCNFKALEDENVRFFLCGSLHGGTGACGVPVLGQFLSGRKEEKGGGGAWRIGGCLLGPYLRPPDLPFVVPKDRSKLTSEGIKKLIKENEDHPAFKALGDPGKEELAKQILFGFYAEPDAMPKRASHSLSYYETSIAKHFDELFVISKPTRDIYGGKDSGKNWSNGGSSQNNPLNSAEVVAAIAALNFFGDSLVPRQAEEIYTIACSTDELNSQNLKLHDLPRYQIGTGAPIDPEKVVLASAITRHLILHQIPWEKPGAAFTSDYAVRNVYEKREDKKTEDKDAFRQTSSISIEFMKSTFDPQGTLGWSHDVSRELNELLATDKKGVGHLEEKLKKSAWRRFFKGEPNLLGQSKVSLDAFEFAKWIQANPTFNRGDYWRYVWSMVYAKIESQSELTNAVGA